MTAPLHRQLIDRILYVYTKAEEDGVQLTLQALADRFCVSVDAVHRIIREWEAGASLEDLARHGQQGQEHASRDLTPEAKAELLQIVESDPAGSLHDYSLELQARTGKEVSIYTLCQGLQELGITRKKITRRALEANEALQSQYTNYMELFCVEQILWGGELGKNNNISQRLYGYAPEGEPAFEDGILVKNEQMSSVAWLSGSKGLLDWYTIKGSVGNEDFYLAVQATLVPYLRPFPEENSVVILDNCRKHHNSKAIKLIESTGAIVIFLPPYSPCFNPIESLFNNIEQWLQTRRCWVNSVPSNPYKALHTAFSSIRYEDCVGFIDKCGIYTWAQRPADRLEEERKQALAVAAAAAAAALLLFFS